MTKNLRAEHQENPNTQEVHTSLLRRAVGYARETKDLLDATDRVSGAKHHDPQSRDLALRIYFLFPKLEVSQHQLLFTMHFHRTMVCSLLGLGRRAMAITTRRQLEKTCVLSEETLLTLVHCVRDHIPGENLTALQQELLERFFLTIPFDDPSAYLDHPLYDREPTQEAS